MQTYKILEHIQKTRPDVISLTGPNELEEYEWDRSLENQDEIINLIGYILGVPEKITAKQIRLGLLGFGVSIQNIELTINKMPEPQKSQALITWEYATIFERENPMIADLGSQLGLTSEQIDYLFMEASKL